jgi:SAM domain (Sterile alpha motif)/PH domain
MSPLTPMTPRYIKRSETAFKVPPIPELNPEIVHRPISTLTEVVANLNTTEVAQWTPQQVKRWMQKAGFEQSIIEKFEENDISGEVLVTLKFEDLRELDIRSFGQRHKLWNAIHNLRDSATGPTSPTVIDCASDEEAHTRKPKAMRKKVNRRGPEDIISPLESVSIVGIEQLMPKPHKCAKGENCPKWRKQQRLIEAFKNEHPISPEGGMILVAGDPGNPLTADATRPFSEAQPSVVASSDVLGPGPVPNFRLLEESTLATVATRDPQDNVKQFLNFQHVDMAWSSEEPATPPYEMFPALTPLTPVTPLTPHQGLQRLPKLAIPGVRPPARSASAMAFSPHPMDRAEALSPDLRNATRSPQNVYRFGTPFSEMDVPVTAINLGPISRDISQSVPPNMSYRHAPNQTPIVRSQSRSSRRPSFPILPRLDENPPIAHSNTFSPIKGPIVRSAEDVNHAGWMKKRKTRMLRHEWHEHHFTLTGTRLAMHKDEQALDVLESIDIDDYAIACSSLASSKLNAAFKAMNIKLGKEKGRSDDTAFAFQLIPAAIEKGQRLKKRDSTPGSSTKTHHFAVKTRDERIDWMRELMLAKALKQKGEGFEINVNGNMI